TIPIVCTLAADAVAAGLVSSLSHPGGNITGVTTINLETVPKLVELAHLLVPDTKGLAALINPKFPMALPELSDLQATAHSLGLNVTVLNASGESEIDAAFATLPRDKVGALIVNPDPLLLGQREQIVRLAARHEMPTIYFFRDFVDAGGL